ncbi:MAG: hypothetical protein GF311_19205 [Candidatus Lokiarchaeota archaeon]|nr:hypothetical protein [Candidatus Lokiarchaeota archaeon]
MNESTEKDTSEDSRSFSKKAKDYFKNLVDFSSYDTKTILFMILVVILVGVSLFLIYILIFEDPTILYKIVIDWFVNPIHLIGIWGIFLFVGVMAIQGLIIPIPSEIVLFASGMIWGLWVGGVMGIIGSVAAGILCFYISRRGGRPLAEKFVGSTAIDMADNFIHKYGIGAIIFARFLPFIAFDPISYASGIVDLDSKKYTLATFIGSIPRAFFYSFLGSTLSAGLTLPVDLSELPLAEIEAQANAFNLILVIIALVLGVMFIAYYLVSKYWSKKLEKE